MGVLLCMACLGFVAYNLKTKKTIKCTNKEKCVITRTNKSCCAYCRMQKYQNNLKNASDCRFRTYLEKDATAPGDTNESSSQSSPNSIDDSNKQCKVCGDKGNYKYHGPKGNSEGVLLCDACRRFVAQIS